MTLMVKEKSHLQALPFRVVLRTATGLVVERDDDGWGQMGKAQAFRFSEEDFPAKVLWTYADEITPPDIDPDMAVEFVRQLRAKAQEQAGVQETGEDAVDSTGSTEGVDQGEREHYNDGDKETAGARDFSDGGSHDFSEGPPLEFATELVDGGITPNGRNQGVPDVEVILPERPVSPPEPKVGTDVEDWHGKAT